MTMGTSSGRRRRGRARWIAAGATVALLALPACGEQSERSLCTVYADYLTARSAIRSVDPTAETAAGAATIVERYLDVVRQLRETDSSNAAQLDELEVAVADALRTLESVEDDADYATWAPLVADDLETASTAGDRVEALLDPQCIIRAES